MAKSKTPATKKPAASKAKPEAASKPAAKGKAPAKAAPASKAVSKEKPKPAVEQKPLTKTQIIQNLADRTQLSKKQVGEFFDHLLALITEQVSTGNPGKLTLPTLAIKLELKDVPARPERPGPDPKDRTKTIMYAAKPASRKIKATAMKSLQETAAKK